MYYNQSGFDIRCEWGLSGIRQVGGNNCITIIVDVLSFSTCVDVATSRGAAVFPYRWKDESANAYAASLGAELAGSRGETGRYSLSPESMLRATRVDRIVLPSPNGSELTTEAELLGGPVIAGCFRNCVAIARYAASQGKSITVVPCGERWPDGTLRPAVEDYAAAGAMIAALPGTRSSEAVAAAAIWNAVRRDLGQFLVSCTSGRELIERGFESDVHLAAQVNSSTTVPILHQHAFIDAISRPDH